MNAARLPLTAAIRMAYTDAFAALRALPYVVLSAVGVLVASTAFSSLLINRFIPADSLLGRDIVGLATNFLMTPVYIAVHRYIVLGEITPRYVLDAADRRFQLFFYWSAALFILPTLADALIRLLLRQGGVSAGIALAASFAMVVVSLRVTALFPAIAVDAPGATWRNAWEDSRGHTWYLVLLLIGTLLPLSIVAAILARLASASLPGSLVRLVLAISVVMLGLTLLVAIASRFFLTLADRVLRDADEQTPPI